MNTIDSTRLLLELRSLAAEAQRAPALGAGKGVAAGGAATAAPDFGALLKESLNQVNSLQQSSAELSTAFEQGQAGLDITRVMVEAQKATLAFRAMTEVRNRLVSAYQEVMNMAI
jgi:flagellar hook-basal body complex protein FliE